MVNEIIDLRNMSKSDKYQTLSYHIDKFEKYGGCYGLLVIDFSHTRRLENNLDFPICGHVIFDEEKANFYGDSQKSYSLDDFVIMLDDNYLTFYQETDYGSIEHRIQLEHIQTIIVG